MPVLDKGEHKRLKREFRNRVSVLLYAFSSRGLNSSSEGVTGGRHWVDPDTLCATIATASELRIAVDDIKTILAELKRLK
jgi:hypothetical protein